METKCAVHIAEQIGSDQSILEMLRHVESPACASSIDLSHALVLYTPIYRTGKPRQRAVW